MKPFGIADDVSTVRTTSAPHPAAGHADPHRKGRTVLPSMPTPTSTTGRFERLRNWLADWLGHHADEISRAGNKS